MTNNLVLVISIDFKLNSNLKKYQKQQQRPVIFIYCLDKNIETTVLYF